TGRRGCSDGLELWPDVGGLQTSRRAGTESRSAHSLRCADAGSIAGDRTGTSQAHGRCERIASTLARFVRFNRSYQTLNNYYRMVNSLNPADLQEAGKKYFTD